MNQLLPYTCFVCFPRLAIGEWHFVCCLSLSPSLPGLALAVRVCAVYHSNTVCVVLDHCTLQVWGVSAVVGPPLASGKLPQDYLEQECGLLD